MNKLVLLAAAGALALSACATTPETSAQQAVGAQRTQADFERDRQAILAMVGDYKVTFDFIETVALAEGYELKDRKLSGGYEVVRVVEDRSDFISLQHILVVGGDTQFPIKHWRQDWTFEPEQVLTFIGGNAWDIAVVSDAKRRGAWAQEVYQVDDSPRYGAVGSWTYDNGVPAWQPAPAWRPLPRRDMTTRDDCHVVDAVNRHAITPAGWVHEQDNTKTVLAGGTPDALVREIGINTYVHSDEFDPAVAEEYWEATQGYWAGVRAIWEEFEIAGDPFAIALKGETGDLYMPLLTLASEVQEGDRTEADAIAEAARVIGEHTTLTLAPLAERLR